MMAMTNSARIFGLVLASALGAGAVVVGAVVMGAHMACRSEETRLVQTESGTTVVGRWSGDSGTSGSATALQEEVDERDRSDPDAHRVFKKGDLRVEPNGHKSVECGATVGFINVADGDHWVPLVARCSETPPVQ
jgi:hypothetical protein